MVFNEKKLDTEKGRWHAQRLLDEPIIHSGLHTSIGENIQGPSLIRVPKWIPDPLGRYYLYFADHKGRYIRLAYSDELAGPWTIHPAGALQLEESHFPTSTIPKPVDFVERSGIRQSNLLHSLEFERSTPHIASPDVHVNEIDKTIHMYFHGLEDYGVQKTRLATSVDGISFQAEPEILCSTYLRVAPLPVGYLGVVMPGVVYTMKGRRGPFIDGTQVFPSTARHHALLVNQEQCFIFWTEVGEAPEHIKVSCMALNPSGQPLIVKHLKAVLKPELEWEGANSENKPSVRSVSYGRVNQLRDPCIYVEEDRVYLLYAGGGESAIGIAELKWISHE